ncbi:hypothetical protein KP509_03G100400 [Ceratopteris richardii]|uniref:TIR domain-containing protein n=1 Tax=Ceratopteris richardii TaxID=49495 RepID=A0A8T2V6M5_CERRI|nr:hypothetical protein KP509_03G100400 [Ceratopteris richardii]
MKSSSWCLNEVFQIMKIQEAITTCKTPRKVVHIFYDVDSSMEMHMPHVKRSNQEQVRGWVKALKGLLNLKGFKYDSKSAVVSELELCAIFLQSKTLQRISNTLEVPRSLLIPEKHKDDLEVRDVLKLSRRMYGTDA